LGERILGSKKSQHRTATTESLALDSYNVYSSPPRVFAQVTLQTYHKSVSNDGLQVAHHVQLLQAAKPIRPKKQKLELQSPMKMFLIELVFPKKKSKIVTTNAYSRRN
jgi:hypothetical protein